MIKVLNMRIFDADRWQEIFSALKKNRLRTFFTAFGVFWGIFMLVIMMGSGSGLENAVGRDMGDMATNSVFMWTQRTTMPYKGFAFAMVIRKPYWKKYLRSSILAPGSVDGHLMEIM